MRIIARNHRDYYDTVQAFGTDRSLVYLREQKVLGGSRVGFGDLIKFPERILLSGNKYDRKTSKPPLFWRWLVVGFCGKVYPGVTISAGYESPRVTLYDVELVHSFVAENCGEAGIFEYEGKSRRSKWSKRYSKLYPSEKQEIIAFFDSVAAVENKFLDRFMEFGTPILAVVEDGRYSTTYKDANLKDLEFFKKFDASHAYQEISMFLGGIASPEKPIPPVSDDDMRDAKGFDAWSFRKEPKK